VVAEFIESGTSASTDRRPSLQRMINRACDGQHPFARSPLGTRKSPFTG
jgi:hypothetical protein